MPQAKAKPSNAPTEADLRFETAAPGGAAPAPVAGTAGDSTSSEAMVRLRAAVADLKVTAIQPVLEQALIAVKAGEFALGCDLALKALGIDERNGVGWWLLAICREKAGDLRSAFACYESALKLLPDHAAIANDLGRLAYSLGQMDSAEKLFAYFLARNPGHPEGANNLACALRDQNRFEEAIETLRTVIYAAPDNALLWNTLGTILNEQGEIAQASTFYDEAIRLDSAFARARYNRGNARLSCGDVEGALSDVEAALPLADAPDRPMMLLARATTRMAGGDLVPAFEDYEIRLDPAFPGVTRFLIERPRWTPETDVRGKSVLIVGEQGLGDEIMFANTLPDLADAIGPGGQLHIAVEPRLVPLFQRSFPTATVGAHATYKVDGHIVRALPSVEDASAIDCWTPMASLMRRFRPSLAAFPVQGGFLIPDPARVDHWRRELAALGDGLKVGVLWKSLKLASARQRFYSPFDAWQAVFATPGARFVNLQYGDCEAELEAARGRGFDLWTPPGIDLREDLDDVGALTSALDLVISPMNATANIAAGCGARTWIISTPGAWPRLGSPGLPWYPTARAFTPPALNQWDPVMSEIARALASET